MLAFSFWNLCCCYTVVHWTFIASSRTNQRVIYAEIRQHNIFVFYDDHDVSLGNPSATSSCNATSLTPTDHSSCPCVSSGRRGMKLIIMAIKELVVEWAIKVGEKIHKKIWHIRFHWGVPASTSLCFDYVTLQGLVIIPDVPVHILLEVTTQSCQNQAEFVYSDHDSGWNR